MKKIAFVFLMLAFMLPVTAHARFSDVETSEWYSGYAERAAGEGWFSGYEDGTFRPHGTLTRAECAKVLYSFKYGGELPQTDGMNYPDAVKSEWYAPYASLNFYEELLLCPDGVFRPDDAVTREEAAAAVMRLIWDMYGGADSCTGDEYLLLDAFPDSADLDGEYAEYMARAVADGIIAGSDGMLLPREPLTRAQFAKLIVSAYRPLWSEGSILPDDGSVVWSESRIYSEPMYLPASMCSVDFSVYKLAFDYCGEDGTRLLNSGWLTEETYLPPGFYRIVIAKNDDSRIYADEGRTFSVEYGARMFEGGGVKKIAHRGFSAAAPENTLESLRAAAWAGFGYSECDIRWTSDEVPVLLHDETIDRTSDGSGRLADMTFDEVRGYDFGSWFDEEYAGARIPSFEEYIAECAALGIHPYIEIYDSESFTAGRAVQLINIVRQYGMENSVTWLSNWISSLYRIKTVDPSAALRLMFVTVDIDTQYIKHLISIKTKTNEVGIDVDINALDPESVRRIKEAGFSVECYGGDGSTYPYGITGITCDSP